MTHSPSHGGKPYGTWVQEVVERRADRASWNKITGGNLHKIGEVSIGRHYLIPDAFLPYRNESVPVGVLPGLDANDDITPRTIASVHSKLSYVITLLGDETLENCGVAAHLKLTPRRDPQRYNIRDMWVRPSDFRLCKAVFASLLYQDSTQGHSSKSVDTAELDENGLITSFSLFAQMHLIVATNAFEDDGTFSHVSWAEDKPAYLFDYEAWKASGATYDPAISAP